MTVSTDNNLQADIIRRMVQVLVTFLIQAAILFGAASTLRWRAAWGYIALYLLFMAVSAFFLLRRSPETIAERGRASTAENWQTWDKILGTGFAIFYFLGILLVAGLDERFGWTESLAAGWQIAGFAGFVLGSGLFAWAMIANAYFSTAVRIQDDRGHQVCTTGPHRFVRHPGYVGAGLQSLAMPLLFGSWWALLPGAITVLLLILRTALEDKTLHRELPGYAEYAQQVRYRLLPGVW